MKLRWIGAAVAVLVVAGAAFYYFTEVPGRLADDHVEDARPVHDKVAFRLRRVFATFEPRTFTTPARYSRALDRADTPDEFLRALRRTADAQRRRLAPARRAVKRASRGVRQADRDALFEVPSAPFLDGRGDLEKADAIVERERRYLRQSRTFLDRYERLVEWGYTATKFIARFGRRLAIGLKAIPQDADSPEEFAVPVDRLARQLDVTARQYGRRKPPPVLRRDQRATVRFIREYADELRALAAAVRALDLARVNQSEDNLTEIGKRAERAGRGTLRRLILRSGYRRQVERLERMDKRIVRAYKRV